MNKIKIIIDSTADLTPEYIKEHDIDILPLGVTFGDVIYHDGQDIDVPTLYEKVKEYNVTPKTSTIPVGELYEAFKKYIDLGYDIFFVSV